MKQGSSRRRFLAAAGAAGVASAASSSTSNGKPAILGGSPVRTTKFPSWPRVTDADERQMLEVLRSGKWFRGGGKMAERFETEYAKLLGASYCLATANGTSALITALGALGIGPGDEAIVPPYTFVATINAVLLRYALPVFVDTDPATFQIDAGRIEAAMTENTRVILPVHIGGSAADLDRVLATAGKRGVPVIEDACQAHLGEWRGKRLGTLGTAGCFSFQVSKNLPSGEGGAMVTADADLLEKAFTFHNNGRGRKTTSSFRYEANGANLRMTEFQASLLLTQMPRIEAESKLRDENAAYLTKMLSEIPGIEPARQYPGATRSAWHLYMLRYRPEQFAGLPRKDFLRALSAEGIPGSGGYAPLNREPFIQSAVRSKAYRALYSAARLKQWEEQNQCPANDRVCEEAVWFTQTTLLAARRDMEQIAEAIRKIQTHAAEIKRA